jgi:hypothetical protein
MQSAHIQEFICVCVCVCVHARMWDDEQSYVLQICDVQYMSIFVQVWNGLPVCLILTDIEVDGLFLVKFLKVKFNAHSPKCFRVLYIDGPTDEGEGGERDFHSTPQQ